MENKNKIREKYQEKLSEINKENCESSGIKYFGTEIVECTSGSNCIILKMVIKCDIDDIPYEGMQDIVDNFY